MQLPLGASQAMRKNCLDDLRCGSGSPSGTERPDICGLHASSHQPDRSARTCIHMSAQKGSVSGGAVAFRTRTEDPRTTTARRRTAGISKAYALNPGSSAAKQEIYRTQKMIEQERRRVKQTVKEAPTTSGR